MSKRVRPKEFPLAVLFALICFSSSIAQIPSATPAAPIPNLLSLDEALRLANTQASSFQTAAINERIAAEDVRQAQAASLPKTTAPRATFSTPPVCCSPRGEPRLQSFVSNDGIGVTNGLVEVSGDFDIAGRDRKSTRLNSSHIPLSRM